MQTFKRIVISILSVLIAFVAFSAVIAVPYLHSELDYFQDAQYRQELAGSIDTLFLGSSQMLAGVMPAVVDEELGSYSYNLSSNSSPMYARRMLLEKELERNPVDTVVLGVSFNSLSKATTDGHADGDLFAICKFDSLGEMASYAVQNLTLKEGVDLYAWIMNRGFSYWSRVLTGRYSSGVYYEDRGYGWHDPVDLTQLSDEERSGVVPETIDCNFNEESVEEFHKIAQLCQEHGAKLIVIQVPLSDYAISHITNGDEFDAAVKDLCDEDGVDYYDFNLLKNRTEILSDSGSFYEENHMADPGAEAFSEELGGILLDVKRGEVVQGNFYSSYIEMHNLIQ